MSLLKLNTLGARGGTSLASLASPLSSYIINYCVNPLDLQLAQGNYFFRLKKRGKAPPIDAKLFPKATAELWRKRSGSRITARSKTPAQLNGKLQPPSAAQGRGALADT